MWALQSNCFWFILKLFYDTEKNDTRLLPELNCDSSEIRAVRRVNEETYIMSQNKVLGFFLFINVSLFKIVSLTRGGAQYNF